MENSDFGCPKGNYIYYERTKYGDEKQSYIHFAADERDAEITGISGYYNFPVSIIYPASK